MRKIKAFGKKVLSGTLAFAMLLSVGYTTVYAAEDTIQVDEQGIVSALEDSEKSEDSENLENSIPEPEEADEENGSVEDMDTDDLTAEDMTSEEYFVEEESTESAEEGLVEENDSDVEENNIEEALLLNFLILEQDYVKTPSTQYVVADVGDENTVVSEAVLTYTNMTTGVSYQKAADTLLSGTMLFNLSFTPEQAGQYQITTLIYQVNGVEYTINIPETGAVAVFGVDTEVEVDPYAWLLDEERDTEHVDKCEDIVQAEGTDNYIEISDAESAQQLTQSLFRISDSNMNNLTRASSSGNMIIVLDPGHGGTDSGATRTWNGVDYIERDINLKIAQACRAELEAYAGVTVYMTRTDNNTTLSLTDRTNYAKSVGADVFISLHINSTASTSATATGAEVIIPNASYNIEIHNTAKELGNIILEKLNAIGINKRTVYSRDTTIGETYPDGSIADYYTVIYNSKENGMPGIIVEHAFVSNEADCINLLGSDEKLQQIGIQDATAIAEYYGLSNSAYNGVNYSAVYDYEYYMNQYPDLKAAYEGNPQKALEHFVNYGMNEGRQGCKDFNVTYYKNRYVDLRNVYGTNLKNYYLHYITIGQREGRNGRTPSALVGTVTRLDGVDYSAVYDFNYYINKYSDVKSKYLNDDIGALRYFVDYGMKAGQQAIATFDVTSYAYRYYELRKVYKNDIVKYYLHYINYGKQEGRVAIGTKMIQDGLMTYEGTDYSAVYNVGYYANKYSDLRNLFGFDDELYLKHFITYGMKEGRQAISTFNVTSYRYQYPDLRVAYGMDLKSYYLHYIMNGKAEGRKATGTTSLQNPVTTLDGVNYSAVYDYYYYTKYADVKNTYGDDDVSVLKHFINYGTKEGRQGNKDFIVSCYKSNYNDLQGIYGITLKSYYLHYINYGKGEGRIANRFLYYNIMGTGSVTVDQMVAYYNAHAAYPAFYGNSDAPDIRTFCQIYMEECNAEGVKTEVAFCQAMLETGFLKFGGDVSISQYNFAGLGATGGVPGLSFASVRQGIRAQVQHLKAYASTEPLNNTCVDPRFNYVTRGNAPYIEWLGMKENPNGYGWASAQNYGYTIRDNYIYSLLTY